MPILPIRIPVCNADGLIVERVADPARIRRLGLAANATVVRASKRSGGQIVRILMAEKGNDVKLKFLKANPRKYTFLEKSEVMPTGVHTLRHLPSSTRSLYCTAQTDCITQGGVMVFVASCRFCRRQFTKRTARELNAAMMLHWTFCTGVKKKIL